MNSNPSTPLTLSLVRCFSLWAPPPTQTVSEWADAERKLSPESSAAPGQWRTSKTPYLREIMDTMNDTGIEEITFMKSAQVGATEALLNDIGFCIDQDPSPMLMVLPAKENGADWSRERLGPMVRDTPCLTEKVSDFKSRDSNNTVFHKSFPGGYLAIAGSNAPAGLASKPVRRILFDEVDRMAASAGSEGDPISLAKKRATTFWNRQYVYMSTPTDELTSRIQKLFNLSDQRHYYVPCPHCDEFHLLSWNYIHFETDEDDIPHPETAAHYCPECGCAQTDTDLPGMIADGEWRAHKPEVKGHAGFFINELYSPWVKFSETVTNFLEAKDNPQDLKVWVNTALGEVWREGKAIGNIDTLMERRENYDAELLPAGVKILTAAVDVQDDRLEMEVLGSGKGFESWSIEHIVMVGDTSRQEVWKQLALNLRKIYDHELNYRLRIMGCGIDTGGHRTREVYAFCKPRLKQRVFALKGDGGAAKPLVAKPTRSNLGKVYLFKVGVNTAKDSLSGYLAQEEEGPCYCHFPHNYSKTYFRQLLSEKRVVRRGALVWVKKSEGAANEALDLRVYNMAVLEILGVTAERLAKITGPIAGRKRRGRKRGRISRGVA